MDFLKKIQEVTKKLDKRIDWDEYFMSICLLTSIRSSCNRLHVGCLIVRDNRILSTGYNGFLAGYPHKSIVKNNHEQATVHAEQNAISHAARNGININKSKAYITHYPCINCFKSLLSSGINEIYYLNNYKNDSTVEELIRESNILIKQVII